MTVVESPLFAEVREMLVQVLAVDESDVQPQSRFFDDLGGESIDVLELSFLAEKRYNLPIRFEAMFKPTTAVGSGTVPAAPKSAALGPAAVADLRAQLDFLNWSLLGESPSIDDLKSVFTVETIVRVLERQLAQHRE